MWHGNKQSLFTRGNGTEGRLPTKSFWTACVILWEEGARQRDCGRPFDIQEQTAVVKFVVDRSALYNIALYILLLLLSPDFTRCDVLVLLCIWSGSCFP